MSKTNDYKQCATCGYWKHVKHFWRDNRTKDGYKYHCKLCCNKIYSKDHYNVPKYTPAKRTQGIRGKRFDRQRTVATLNRVFPTIHII